MSNCSICSRKITRKRQLYLNTEICLQCIKNINDYISEENNLTDAFNQSTEDTLNSSLLSIINEEDLIYIDGIGKTVSITDDTDLNIISENNIDVLNNHKDALLASLYTQVTFLKTEIEEKNMLIRTLIFKDHHVNADSDEFITMSEYTRCNDEDAFMDVPIDETNIYGNEENNVDELFPDLFKQYEEFIRIERETKLERQRIMDNQLIEIRLRKHNEFINITSGSQDEKDTATLITDLCKTDENEMWPHNTVLITGSSILNGVDEYRMKNVKDHLIKVRAFPGARINDMYSYLTPLFFKNPTYIFLHIGSNDSIKKSSSQILEEIMKLKDFIESKLPYCIVFLSAPVLRLDNRKAQATLNNLKYDMRDLTNVIYHENIDESCLGENAYT